MRAMILAAGFGTRLWPLTLDRTKPAIPFLNKPLITYCVSYLRRFAISEIMVNLHHQAASIEQVLGKGEAFGIPIHYSYEKEILGTSGALDQVRDWLMSGTFIVMNGKVITDIDLDAALQTHRQRGALATLILKENTAREHFSLVHLDPRDNIEGFGGFPAPTATETSPPLMFTGIQILEPRIFDYIPRGRFSHSTTDVYPVAIAQGETITAHISSDQWYELSTLARYLDISLQWLAQDTRANGSVVCGEGSTIAPSAKVSSSILWQRVRVEAGAELDHTIIGDDVVIPAHTKLERVAVVRRDRCDKLERGEVMGENVIVPIV
jgi:NDP-sugar pyrophosphorylase family protein